jgi:hypothetical protein
MEGSWTTGLGVVMKLMSIGLDRASSAVDVTKFLADDRVTIEERGTEVFILRGRVLGELCGGSRDRFIDDICSRIQRVMIRVQCAVYRNLGK